MLSAGVEQLGELVDVRVEETSDLAIDVLVRSVVHAEQRAGVSVVTAVPEGLRATGKADDLAVVLRTLVRSLAADPAARPVIIRGERRGGAIALLVEPANLGLDSDAIEWTSVSAEAAARARDNQPRDDQPGDKFVL